MWARYKSFKINKVAEGAIQEGKMNVNDEYQSALKTKSYADFFTKAQSFLNKRQHSSPTAYCCCTMSNVLLEPGQEAVATVLDATILSKNSNLKSLIHNYFEISAEASNICSHLLTSIQQIQFNYQFIQRVLDLVLTGGDISGTTSTEEWHSFVMSELNSFNLLKNPFSNPNRYDFKLVLERYSSVLHHLKSRRKKIVRKIKLIKYFKKGTEVCITATCGVLAVATIALAAHTIFGLLMGPALLSLPLKSFLKKRKKIFMSYQFLQSGFLRKLGTQLDVAAKGAYILNRDFDTMSRLVGRLHDEIEHSKAIVKFCLERKDNRFPLQEVVKELKKSNMGFKKQVEELEEHVYLCLVTINKARSLVIEEMASTRKIY
ncbi:hypothetical protein C5167_008576 [Papaver somniferum]|uniref:Uncharacterized protein n=1 Tax=Papaver somniferum TaxID=3469 RepID=A0A4Y7JW05_PAPSO|nr:UPF0496 protein At1g20180-like [Papaver somniferum]RZC64887.1 hypothetical protein C5167_008576 [Papaver somniferum]